MMPTVRCSFGNETVSHDLDAGHNVQTRSVIESAFLHRDVIGRAVASVFQQDDLVLGSRVLGSREKNV